MSLSLILPSTPLRREFATALLFQHAPSFILRSFLHVVHTRGSARIIALVFPRSIGAAGYGTISALTHRFSSRCVDPFGGHDRT